MPEPQHKEPCGNDPTDLLSTTASSSEQDEEGWEEPPRPRLMAERVFAKSSAAPQFVGVFRIFFLFFNKLIVQASCRRCAYLACFVTPEQWLVDLMLGLASSP